jgi:DNA invertase Pin-like site-specific DNA recombinase
MKRAALYHRVSTVDQDPTLASKELRAAAAARGYEVAMEVEETGSGARNNRPGLQRVMDSARKGLVQAVLVYKLDRFGRSVLDVLSNVKELGSVGCRFVAVTQGLDVQPDGDPVSRLILVVLAAVAEFERDLIRERTRTGMAKAREVGKAVGRPPVHVDIEKAKAIFDDANGPASWSRVARMLGVSRGTLQKAMARLEGRSRKGPENQVLKTEETGGQSVSPDGSEKGVL